MYDSKDDYDFQLCLTELKQAGIEPTIYTINEEKLSKINPKVLTKIEQIKQISRNLNCSVGIVGGFVRDLVLGEPTEDVDFVIFKGDINHLTETIATQLGGKIGKMSNKTMTTQVRLPDNLVFEFNSTRKERYEYPSRIPIVEEATIVEDLSRRDFTINAMILFSDQYIDIFDGTTHLQNKIIQTTRNPETVFQEDYLRMFRAIRFACRLDFRISEETMKGIKSHVKNILDVPSERILNELKQSIEYNPLLAFQLMVELKIFETMFPQIANEKLSKNEFTVKSKYDKIEAEIRYLKENNVRELFPYLAIILKEVNLKFEEDDNLDDVSLVERKLISTVNQILKYYKFSNKEKLGIHKHISLSIILERMLDVTITDLGIRQFIKAADPETNTILLLLKANQSIKVEKKELSELEERIINIGANRDLIFFDLALGGIEIADHFKVEGQDIGRAKHLLSLAIMGEEITNTKQKCLKYLEKNLFK